MTQLCSLKTLQHELNEAGYESPEYQSLLEAAQAGWIPAKQDESGQWVYDAADIRFIADSLMLERCAA